MSIKDNGNPINHVSSESIGGSNIENRAKNINAEVNFDKSSGYKVRVVIKDLLY